MVPPFIVLSVVAIELLVKVVVLATKKIRELFRKTVNGILPSKTI